MKGALGRFNSQSRYNHFIDIISGSMFLYSKLSLVVLTSSGLYPSVYSILPKLSLNVAPILSYQIFNPIQPGAWGGEAESAPADFILRELPCYLSNTYETLPLLLKFTVEQDCGKKFFQGLKLLSWQPDFRRHV